MAAKVWPQAIDQARSDVASQGYCVASWQPEVVALAAPLVLAQRPAYVLNFSVSTLADQATVARELRKPLLDLRDRGLDALLAADAHGS